MATRVTSGVSSAGASTASSAAAEAARRAAEAARRAAEEARRGAQEAAQRALAQAQVPKGLPGVKADTTGVASPPQTKHLDVAAEKASLRINGAAVAAGLPRPDSSASAAKAFSKALQKDSGDFSNRPSTSLFGNPTLGAFPTSSLSESSVSKLTGPAVALTAATTGAKSPDEARANLVAAQQAYDDANQKAEELSEALNAELAKLGPALTDEQKRQYVQQFRANHADVFAAEEASAQALSDALNDPLLLEAARSNPDVAKQCLEAATFLGESSQAKAALDWATKVSDPNGPAGTAFEGLKDQIADNVIAPAITTASGQLLAENNGDSLAALQQLSEMTAPLAQLYDGGSSIQSGIETIKEAIENNDPHPLLAFSQESKLGAAFAGVGAAYGLVNAANDAQRGDWTAFIEDVANSGRNGALVAGTVLSTLAETGRIATQSGMVAAEVLARIAPAFGVLANTIVLAESAKDLQNDPSFGRGVQALGDLAALVGAYVGLGFPGVGQIIEGAGVIVSALGGLLVDKEKQEALDDESEGILLQLGVDADVARTLAHGDDQPERLSSDLGLTPAQIQDLAKRHPTLFDAPGLAQAAIDAAKACGMKGQDAVGFIDMLSKGRQDFASELLGVMPNMEGSGASPTATDSAWRNYVQSHYPDAYAYAQQHAPDQFSPSAESRFKAGQDFEFYAGMTDRHSAYANLCHQNKGDEAYISEFINRMKANGDLDNFVQTIDQSINGSYRSGAKAALEAAVNTGVLSEAEIQSYVNGPNGDAWRSILGR